MSDYYLIFEYDMSMEDDLLFSEIPRPLFGPLTGWRSIGNCFSSLNHKKIKSPRRPLLLERQPTPRGTVARSAPCGRCFSL
jgi:hypothetical protein